MNMAKYFVEVNESVALIHDRANQKCWVIKVETPDRVEECVAPQMYNVRLSPFFEECGIEDKYPFPVASEMLQKNVCKSFMLHFILVCMDKGYLLELRKDNAKEAIKTEEGKYGKDTFEWLSNFLLNTPLPEVADINHDILDVMSEPFKKLLQKVFLKHRKIDILAD